MKYYHITRNDQQTLQSIRDNGLRANEQGEIFLFENRAFSLNGVVNYVADHIANNQIFADEYIMFEVNSKGITTLEREDIGEFPARLGLQWIAKQLVIEPKYIKPHGVYKNTYKSPHPAAMAGQGMDSSTVAFA
jgi:hypothetical protein